MTLQINHHLNVRPSVTALICLAALTGCSERGMPQASSTSTRSKAQRPVKATKAPLPASRRKTKPVSKEEVARRSWLKVAPALRKADEKRAKVFASNQERFDQSVRSLVTQQGIDAFVEKALGLQSKAIALKGSSQHEAWLQKLFVTHVFPLPALKQLVQEESVLLVRKLSEVDNETLVAIKADVELDPSRIQAGKVDVNGIHRHLDDLVGDVQRSVDQSMAKSISSFFFGAAGFEAARQGSRHAMKDESGNVSLLGELVAFGIGFVAEEVTRTVADEVLQTRQSVENDLRDATRSLLSRCTGDGRIARERATALKRHQQALFDAVTQSIGVEPSWAAKNYQ